MVEPIKQPAFRGHTDRPPGLRSGPIAPEVYDHDFYQPKAFQALNRRDTGLVPLDAPPVFENPFLPHRMVNVPRLARAIDWRPHLLPGREQDLSGVDANREVTALYSSIDTAMTRWLGEPAVANWASFGKHASRQAGRQIEQLEAMMRAAKSLSPTAVLKLVKDFAGAPGEMGALGKALWDASGHSPARFMADVELMRDTLVRGNVGIVEDIVPAFNTFLAAEYAGRDGVRALWEMGFGRSARDPYGLLLKAFEKFQAANKVGRKLSAFASTRTEKERSALLATRRRLMFEGNLLMGLQEQWVSLQHSRAFDDPRVARLMGLASKQMTIQSSEGTYRLLPNGGNWASFADRMGLVELPDHGQSGNVEGTFRFVSESGRVHRYQVNPDPAARRGTIYEYFERGMAPDASARLTAFPTEAYDQRFDSLRERIERSTKGLRRDLAGWLDRLPG